MLLRATHTFAVLAPEQKEPWVVSDASEKMSRNTNRQTQSTRSRQQDIFEKRTTVVDRIRVNVKTAADRTLKVVAKAAAVFLTSCGLWAAAQLFTSVFHLKATAALVCVWGLSSVVPAAIIALIAGRVVAKRLMPRDPISEKATSSFQRTERVLARAFTTLTFAGASEMADFAASKDTPRTQTVRLPMSSAELPPSLKAELFFKPSPLKLPEQPWEQLREPAKRAGRPHADATVVARMPVPLSTTELRLDNPWASTPRITGP